MFARAVSIRINVREQAIPRGETKMTVAFEGTARLELLTRVPAAIYDRGNEEVGTGRNNERKRPSWEVKKGRYRR